MGWKPGQTGNAKGRPKGSGPVQQLRDALGGDLDRIVDVLRQQALAGDLGAIRLLLERLVPAAKAQEQPAALDIPEDASLSDAGRIVLRAVADGHLTPGQGAQLIAALGGLARVVEVDELVRRLDALEAHSAKP